MRSEHAHDDADEGGYVDGDADEDEDGYVDADEGGYVDGDADVDADVDEDAGGDADVDEDAGGDGDGDGDALVSRRLRHASGADMSEWSEEPRVRQWPREGGGR